MTVRVQDVRTIGPEVVRKVRARVEWHLGRSERERAQEWAAARASDLAAWAGQIDAAKWDEAVAYAEAAASRAAQILPGVPVRLGGGGDYRLLYFLVRVLRPPVVVETGVAAGWSSHAILSALKKNGTGQLHSSDLPYLSRRQASSYIGVLVPDELRDGWDLHLDGDQINLPRILGTCGPVAMFHYDSAKTARQRQAAWQVVQPHLAPSATVVFDDVQDDAHFADLVGHSTEHRVFGFAGKYLGLLGPLATNSGT